MLFNLWRIDDWKSVSGQLPSKENPPGLGLGFGPKSGLVLGLGATRQLPPKEIVPRLGLALSLGLILGLGGGAIFLGGNCPRILKTMDEKIKIWQVNWAGQVELYRISFTNVAISNNKSF